MLKNLIAKKFVLSRAESRYRDYKKRAFSPLLLLRGRYGAIARAHAKRGRFSLAFKFNAEICFTPWIATDVKDWKKLVFLCGLQSAMDKNINRAASWLARGAALQNSALVARCNTYGFPEEIRQWIWKHRESLAKPEWWRQQFVAHNTRPLFEQLIVHVCYMAASLGCNDELSPILDSIETPSLQNAKKLLQLRIPRQLTDAKRLFKLGPDMEASVNGAANMALLNMTNRLFSTKTEVGYLVESEEMRFIQRHELGEVAATEKFAAICRSIQLIARGKCEDAMIALEPAVAIGRDFISGLDKRPGPRKVFVGGFGWTGSSAVFDAFRGYGVAKEMPGVGDAKFINDGADSEPMIYQGPASVGEMAKECITKGRLSAAAWHRFFRLYVLCDLNTNYFEYKAVNANRLLRSKLGDAYYDVIAAFLQDYCYQQTTVVPPSIENGLARVTKALFLSRADCIGQFSERIVKALFDDSEVILFNNAITTNNVHIIQHIPGDVVYISVNRSILDQMADQRKQNLFFKSTARQFARAKKTKIAAYRSGKLTATGAGSNHRFIDLFFEDWVTSQDLRETTAKDLFGHYDISEESKYFDPSVSQKNVGIYPGVLTKDEESYLKRARARNSGL